MTAPDSNTRAELGQTIQAAGWQTNLHDVGEGFPVMLIHGSGPGVTAWANWRLTIPELAKQRRVIAPDMLGFGYSERPADGQYHKSRWVEHAIGVLDALDVEQADIIGNSFGGGLALALAIAHPKRVRRIVLMGSAGASFPLTPGLDAVWGYEPSLDNMRKLLNIFAFDRSRVTDELAKLRYEASIQPGFQEAFAAMFPAPRQRWIEMLASPLGALASLPHQTLLVHGRDDQVIPLAASQTLLELLPDAQLHVFNKCGHWTQIEQADRFVQLVTNFLNEANIASQTGT